jgi:hypothetical protein
MKMMIQNSTNSRFGKSLIIFLIVFQFVFSGCATHTKQILLGSLVGGVVGAGLGYTVVHHGRDRKYEVPNTIITSALFALGTAGALAFYYHSLDQQKVELTSQFMKPELLKDNIKELTRGTAESTEQPFCPSISSIGKLSLSLDGDTRWVYPTFRKRILKPETTGNELLSSRYTWEILRPGFFVSKEQDPSYFTFDETK